MLSQTKCKCASLMKDHVRAPAVIYDFVVDHDMIDERLGWYDAKCISPSNKSEVGTDNDHASSNRASVQSN